MSAVKDIKLIIFDLDGTLVDAYRAIIKSVNFTLLKFAYPRCPDSKIRRAVGWGDTKLLSAFIEEGDISSALKVYRCHHRQSLRKYSRLLPFTKGLLDYLIAKGCRLAIASNRPTEFTGIILRHLKIKKYFDYVLCADKLTHGKPHPEILNKILAKLAVKKEEALYVGDMAIDVEAARNAGIKSIAVRGGSSTLSEIKKARPFKIIKNLAFLKSCL